MDTQQNNEEYCIESVESLGKGNLGELAIHELYL